MAEIPFGKRRAREWQHKDKAVFLKETLAALVPLRNNSLF